MQSVSPFWDKARHQDRRPFLQARVALARAARGYFHEAGFVEVETDILQHSPGNETHLHALALTDQGEGPLYLRTSPEFAAKKLLAAGERRIVEFARVFRGRESGPLHLTEFTMLEWYRADETYEAVIDDCLALIALAATTCGAHMFSHRTRLADPRLPAERLTLAQAFDRHAGIDLLATLDAKGSGQREELAQAAMRAGIRVTDDDTWSDVFSKVLVERVEPHLGQGRATVLYEYPVPEAALARACTHDPRVAERFEIYMCGVELANGFGELTVARIQRARFEEAMAEKQRRYGVSYPIDEDFLAALAQMPQACGVAIGFDRLVMLASGAPDIQHVAWTLRERAR